MATDNTSPEQPKPKRSSVRHTRAVQQERDKHPLSIPPAEQITERLSELALPAITAQVAYFHSLGLRERVLTLPVMVGLVLSMVWRHVGVVGSLVRLIRTESQLWVTPRHMTQQAFTQRLGSLPAELFLNVLQAILPMLSERWRSRRERPVPTDLAWASERFSDVLAVDGSTLDALLRRTALLREQPGHPLAGRMTALLSVLSRQPQQVWYEPDPQAHDQRFWEQILPAVPVGSLLLFDLGYTNYPVFAALSTSGRHWLTRAKRNLACTLQQTLVHTANVHDQCVWIGEGSARQLARLVEVLYRGQWYRYLTSVTDPLQLPTENVEALYRQRWRIEEAYLVVKRLLGLAFFWTESQNGIAMQLWATWLLYAVLIDLVDAVAAKLHQPFARISVEMVYRSLYFVATAAQRGEHDDAVAYLAANADWLGLIKRQRKTRTSADPSLTNPDDP